MRRARVAGQRSLADPGVAPPTGRRRGWAGIIPGVALMGLVATSALASPPFLPGDLDNDAQLTTKDVARLVNHLNAVEGRRRTGDTGLLSTNQQALADLDGDGGLTTNDVHRLVEGILELPLNPFPRPIAFGPDPFTTNAAVSTLVAYLNEPISDSSLRPANVTLLHLGRDRLAGTADDSNVVSGVVSFSNAACALVLTLTSHLPAGFYRATVEPPITDLAGRGMTRAYSWIFATLGGPDSDGDGLPDHLEPQLAVYRDGLQRLDPTRASTLGDGTRDGDRDADGDDLSNAEEILRLTHPQRGDSDGDGWGDGVEVADGRDPCDARSHPDGRLVGRPPVKINSDSDPPPGIGNLGLLVARPPLVVFRPGDDEAAGGANLGTLLARPPVRITRPSPDESLGQQNLGVIVAPPPLEIARPDPTEEPGLSAGSTLAMPPVEIRRPGADEVERLNHGGLHARPPVAMHQPAADEVQSLAHGGLLARPPLAMHRPGLDEVASVGWGNRVGQPPVRFTHPPALRLDSKR